VFFPACESTCVPTRRTVLTPNLRQVAGVSLCGALKNIVAVAAGLVEGLGWGNNSQGRREQSAPWHDTPRVQRPGHGLC
jgi:hypothetical protein